MIIKAAFEQFYFSDFKDEVKLKTETRRDRKSV